MQKVNHEQNSTNKCHDWMCTSSGCYILHTSVKEGNDCSNPHNIAEFVNNVSWADCRFYNLYFRSMLFVASIPMVYAVWHTQHCQYEWDFLN